MKKIWRHFYIAVIFLFLYAPIFVLIAFSFNESKSRAVFTGFTFKWYEELFQNDLIMSSLGNSLLISCASAILATIIGTLAAVGISRMGKRTKSVVMNLSYLPIINPEIVIGVSLMLLFVMMNQTIGLGFGFITVLFGHITFNLPYVILNVLPKLRQMDTSLYEAAQDLGCPPIKAFMKVVIPEIMPGIISGFLMAFTFSLDDFVISYFTNGSSFQTLPITIYSMTRKKVNPQVNALSAILFLAVLAVLLIKNFIEIRAEKNKKQRV